jgi:hypothetical protein
MFTPYAADAAGILLLVNAVEVNCLKSKVITFVVVFSSSFEFKAKDKVAETDF